MELFTIVGALACLASFWQPPSARLYNPSACLTVSGPGGAELSPGKRRSQLPGGSDVAYIGEIAASVGGDALLQDGHPLIRVGDPESRVRARLGDPQTAGQKWPSSPFDRPRVGNRYWKYHDRIFVEFDGDRVSRLCLGL